MKKNFVFLIILISNYAFAAKKPAVINLQAVTSKSSVAQMEDIAAPVTPLTPKEASVQKYLETHPNDPQVNALTQVLKQYGA